MEVCFFPVRVCLLLAPCLLLAACCWLLAACCLLVTSTLDTKEGYKNKIRFTSSVKTDHILWYVAENVTPGALNPPATTHYW